MVVKGENLGEPVDPARAAEPGMAGLAPAEHPAPAPKASAAREDAAGEAAGGAAAEATACADATPRGAGAQSGLLSLDRSLEGDDAPAAPAVLPPDAPAGTADEARDGGDTRDARDARDDGADRIDETNKKAPGRAVPSPLNALDALGALDPAQVNLLSCRVTRGAAGDTDMRDGIDADEAAPDPAAQFQTIFRQAVLDEVREHAESQDKVEVCGVLVGSVYENSTGAFCYVEGCVRGNYAAGGSAQVTFTAETWQHIDREMEERYPGRKIVGWYHTHPGFGIFLSEMDLFIQRHFFNAPWQTALVYDPQSKERGLFGWNGTEIVRQTFVLDNEIGPAVTEAAGPNLSPKPHGLDESPAGGPPGTTAELTARIKLLEQRQRYMLVGMAALMLVAVVWPLVVLVVLSSSDSAGPGGVGGPAPVAPSPAIDHPSSAVTQGVDSAAAGEP